MLMNMLPIELTDKIASFIPDDSNGEIIHKMRQKTLVSDEQIINYISTYPPEITEDPRYINILLKHIKLSAFGVICSEIRNNLVDKIQHKKRTIKSDECKPYLSKIDEEFIKKNLYLNQEYFYPESLHIHEMLLEMLLGELEEINPIVDWYKLCEAGSLPPITFDYCDFNDGEISHIYNNGWKTNLPTLNDTTKYLTADEKYLIRQVPVWYEYILNILEQNLIHIPSGIRNKATEELTMNIRMVRTSINEN
jgi:hypothetical protein